MYPMFSQIKLRPWNLHMDLRRIGVSFRHRTMLDLAGLGGIHLNQITGRRESQHHFRLISPFVRKSPCLVVNDLYGNHISLQHPSELKFLRHHEAPARLGGPDLPKLC